MRSSSGQYAQEGLDNKNRIIYYQHRRLRLWALRDSFNCGGLPLGYGLALLLHHYHPVMTPKAVLCYVMYDLLKRVGTARILLNFTLSMILLRSYCIEHIVFSYSHGLSYD